MDFFPLTKLNNQFEMAFCIYLVFVTLALAYNTKHAAVEKKNKIKTERANMFSCRLSREFNKSRRMIFKVKKYP